MEDFVKDNKGIIFQCCAIIFSAMLSLYISTSKLEDNMTNVTVRISDLEYRVRNLEVSQGKCETMLEDVKTMIKQSLERK